jgi:hypothetical protein
MLSLTLSLLLVAFYWAQDINWPPAHGFWLRLRQRRPKTSVFLQELEECGKYIAAWLAIAAGLDYLFRLLNAF